MIILMDLEAATESEPDKSIVRSFICMFLQFGHTQNFLELDLAKKLKKTFEKTLFNISSK